ncbi:MAG TPA: GGDEF domain-containing protein, partial [Candidatus Acidoferrum sp.]|nr:GGDEF domain-containing protein [Candidatus Acidoferrum sp.]
MNESINYYITVDAMCVLSLIILVHASRRNVFYRDEMKKQFALAVCLTITVIMAEIGSVIFENRMLENLVPVFIVNVTGFSLSPFIAVVLSKAFSAEKGRFSALLAIPVWLNFAFALSSPWTGSIFYVSDNSYLRGPWFCIYVAAYLCSYAILIVESFKAMRLYQCHIKSTFVMLLVFTFTGTLVQIMLPDLHTSWLCITLSLILYYAYICELLETQDTLTELLNRSVYEQHVNNLKQNASGSVLMFDLDNFKQVNDLYGHQWGDFCLQTIGKCIKDCFLHIGFCYRVGGDEFCVICRTTNEQHLKDALGLFHRKIDDIRKSGDAQNEFPMVSTGYSVFLGLERGYAAAMKEADTQM